MIPANDILNKVLGRDYPLCFYPYINRPGPLEKRSGSAYPTKNSETDKRLILINYNICGCYTALSNNILIAVLKNFRFRGFEYLLFSFHF